MNLHDLKGGTSEGLLTVGRKNTHQKYRLIEISD